MYNVDKIDTDDRTENTVFMEFFDNLSFCLLL